MKRVEWWIAARYLRSRRTSRFVSLITFIATGGVALGVMALIVVIGVMSGLQKDLREKILVANPHLRILTYGEGLRLDDWRRALATVQGSADVVAAAPFVLSQGLISGGHDYAEGVAIVGIAAGGAFTFPAFDEATALQVVTGLFAGLCTTTGAVVIPSGSVVGKTATLAAITTGAICDWGAGTSTPDVRVTAVTLTYQGTKP